MSGRVHVVDDDASFRTAVERRLKLAGYQVATYPSAQQLLDRPPDENEPGCILLDVRIPGLSGPELQGRLNELGSSLPVVFVTGHADTQTTVRTIKAGAEDFLTKPIESEQLLDAIERAMARHSTVRGERQKLEQMRALVAALTPREREVLAAMAEGRTNVGIAKLLTITEGATEKHISNIFGKLDLPQTEEDHRRVLAVLTYLNS